MAISNDINIEPDMAKLTISKPAKPQGVDITKLPIDGPNAPGTSSKPLRYTKVRPPKDPFIKRKKPAGQHTIEEVVARSQSQEEPASLKALPQSATPIVDRFPNLTNPAPYIGPDYSHRNILAANPNRLTHCKDKEAKDKCHVCLLHDFNVSDARLKEAKIRLADAEIIVKSKTSQIEDKLQKKTIEWEGERNLLLQQREEAVKEGIAKAKEEWKETYVSKKNYYAMKEGLEAKYKQVEDQLIEVRSKIFRLRIVPRQRG